MSNTIYSDVYDEHDESEIAVYKQVTDADGGDIHDDVHKEGIHGNLAEYVSRENF